MIPRAYQFRFDPTLSIDDLRGTLRLSILATEAIHGAADVALDAAHQLDIKNRVCRIDGSTAAGRDLVRLFATFVRREFGANAVRFERVRPSRQSA